MDKIISFTEKLNDIINNNAEYIKRPDRGEKLNIKNMLYGSVLTLNSSAIQNVICNFEINDIVSVSKNAFIKKRNNINTSNCFKKINDSILNFIYDPQYNFLDQYNFKIDNNKISYVRHIGKPDKTLFINRTKKRFIGCDGTQINLNKSLINGNDIKSSNKNDYGVCIISSMYDVINNIPINYNITKCDDNNIDKKKVNETKGFVDQMSYLSSNDVIIFDRWYYSNALIKKLNDNDIGYLFRMKNSSNFFKNMHMGKSKIVNHAGKDVQLFKYKIKTHVYCILTSITEKISIKEIKALYGKRWNNESDNKKFKYDVLYNGIRSKNYNSFLTDIQTIRFISIISAFIEYLGKNSTAPNKKINSKNCLEILYSKLLRMLFYGGTGEHNYKEICRIIGIIYKTVTEIVKNRHYSRKRLKPSTKWNRYGNRYGNKK